MFPRDSSAEPEIAPKQLKVAIHPRNHFNGQDVVFILKDSGFKGGDVIEVYHPKPGVPRVLLQVPQESELEKVNIQKDSISIEKTIATQFHLQLYQIANVNKVPKEKVSLQLLELTFRDQFLSRSDMWRFTQSLIGKVVYRGKNVEFCNKSIRCQVYEMWSHGNKVASGYVSADTKVVYRSNTSRFYVFIQMSSEMWEWDHYGDLYFEKAISGFLTELFMIWKKFKVNHEVTIVLFSRNFYPEARNLEDFPADIRTTIQQDKLGRFYQDFYRVAVQNERHEDWTCVLRTLRQLFYHYPRDVLGKDTIHGGKLVDVHETHQYRREAIERVKARKKKEREELKAKQEKKKTEGKENEKEDFKDNKKVDEKDKEKTKVENVQKTEEDTKDVKKPPVPSYCVCKRERTKVFGSVTRIVEENNSNTNKELSKQDDDKGKEAVTSKSVDELFSDTMGIRLDDKPTNVSNANVSLDSSSETNTKPESKATDPLDGNKCAKCDKEFRPVVVKKPTAHLKPRLSTADQGNFLEVLNMSLNVFERHYQDRSLDRTGQMSVVITPGVGVFHVDRLLTNITRQRIIDNGVGSDLVCLGEQPLHAVPLLKFHGSKYDGALDDYTIPSSWINLSFYTSAKSKQLDSMCELYVPRVKVPDNCKPSFFSRSDPIGKRARACAELRKIMTVLDPLHPVVSHVFTTVADSLLDASCLIGFLKLKLGLHGKTEKEKRDLIFDNQSPEEVEQKMRDYDVAVFKHSTEGDYPSPVKPVKLPPKFTSRKKSSKSFSHNTVSKPMAVHRQLSDPEMGAVGGGLTSPSVPQRTVSSPNPLGRTPLLKYKVTEGFVGREKSTASYRLKKRLHSEKLNALDLEFAEIDGAANSNPDNVVLNSSPGIYDLSVNQLERPGAPLINPFDPKYTTIRLTSKRRRWVHIFPKNVSGALVQQHHKEDDALKKDLTTYPTSSSDEGEHEHSLCFLKRRKEGGEDDIPMEDLEEEEAAGSDTADESRRNQFVNKGKKRLVNRHHRRRTASLSNTTRHRSSPSISSADRKLYGMTRNKNTLLWGATGEQEWSAAIKSGVDWKSLTLPACLPITTDFFPSDETMKDEYLESNYSLLPEMMMEEGQSTMELTDRNCGRIPMSTNKVFVELVSQRLSQGFQLIISSDIERSETESRSIKNRKNQYSAPTSTTGSSTDLRNQPVKNKGGTGQFSVIGSGSNSRGGKVLSDEESDIKEYRLSIGTLFHKLELVDNKIEVKVYRPRELPDVFSTNYSYRFRAPYMKSYELSSTKFKTEKLQDYKWNYLDNYICLYSDYFEKPLVEDLRYWRIRMVLVPDFHRSVTRSLMDNRSRHIDEFTYPPLNRQQEQDALDGVVKFIESIHKLTRVSKTSRAYFSPPNSSKPGGTSNTSQSGQNPVRKFSTATPLDEIITAMMASPGGLNFFSPQPPGLPKHCFLSHDGVYWIIDNVEGASDFEEAIKFLNLLLKEGRIKHASGNKFSEANKKIYYGFYIYFIVTGNPQHDMTVNTDTYRQQYHEVEFNPKLYYGINNSCPILLPDLPVIAEPFRTQQRRWISQGPVSIDQSNRSDRSEWGDFVCSTSYSTDIAYLFSLRWVCATGALAGELIASWQRRAQTFNLFLFPIPSDPFALPDSLDCDPLRGPLHLPLILSCNPQCTEEEPLGFCGKHNIFTNFNVSNEPKRIRFLQEEILKRFGFVRFLNELGVSGSGAGGNDANQYLHVTGHAFIMVLTPGMSEVVSSVMPKQTVKVTPASCKPSPQIGVAPPPLSDAAHSLGSTVPNSEENPRPSSLQVPVPTHSLSRQDDSNCNSVASPHEEYFNRLMADKVSTSIATESVEKETPIVQAPGFLWSFNYMLTKRWKSAASGDEALGERLLHDFRNFCANKDDKLRKFCAQYKVDSVVFPEAKK